MSLREGGGDARVWLIRGGREGQAEPTALEHDVAVVGWTDVGELSPDESRDDLQARIRETYGEERQASLASQAGQIYRFIHEVAIGDLVVLPLRTRESHVAIGRVTGGYAYRGEEPFLSTDASNTRPVEWLAKDLPYERFDADLRDAFGQQGTMSEITKPNTAQRLLAVLEGADASAIHVVLKWAPAIREDTIERHREVAEAESSVWRTVKAASGSTDVLSGAFTDAPSPVRGLWHWRRVGRGRPADR
jgi:restriction system protein